MSGVLQRETRDPRPRYDVLQPILLRGDRFRWLRVGVAYRNPDGTIDAYLDIVVLGHRFRLRELPPAASSQDESAAPDKEPRHGG